MAEITRILAKIEKGDSRAAEQLLPLVYQELRKLAASQMARERPGQTLQATVLVHEAYLRLVKPGQDKHWDGCGHFFVAAAEAMRRILVENARRKRRVKRGGDLVRIDLNDDVLAIAEKEERVLALDEALTRFAMLDPNKAELVKLHSFAGLGLDAAASILGISPSTADRWWAYARAWLRVEIGEEKSG